MTHIYVIWQGVFPDRGFKYWGCLTDIGKKLNPNKKEVFGYCEIQPLFECDASDASSDLRAPRITVSWM